MIISPEINYRDFPQNAKQILIFLRLQIAEVPDFWDVTVKECSLKKGSSCVVEEALIERARDRVIVDRGELA